MEEPVGERMIRGEYLLNLAIIQNCRNGFLVQYGLSGLSNAGHGERKEALTRERL